MNTEPLFLGQNTGFGSCEPLVTTCSSTDQNKTLLYVCFRLKAPYLIYWAALVAQLVKKKLPAMQETWVRSLGWKDPLEKGKVTHSSI